VQGIHTVGEIRIAEAELMRLLPPGALMQRAAHALSVQCQRLLGHVYGRRVVLLVGSGGNGGDALYAGARLARLGAAVDALLLAPDRTHTGGLAEFRASGGRLVDDLPEQAELVIDGIIGIGGSGGLRGAAAQLPHRLAGRTVVSVDVPSGVDADTGAVDGPAVSADLTVTFGTIKPGLVTGAGAGHTGQVRLVDIGLGPHLPQPRARILEAADVAGVLPEPSGSDDKYTRGVVGVIAGSVDYPGAGVLSTGAAIHGGAGMVRYLGRAPDMIRARYPEVVVHEDAVPDDVRVQAWVVGPGLGTDDAARSLVSDVLNTNLPVVVDADAITIVAGDPDLVRARAAPTVLTPHDREFERLPVKLTGDRLDSARRAAAELDATLLLKGDATVVAAPSGLAFVNTTGTPWLGTAGSGDVLSGLIGSLLAGGVQPTLAAAVAAHVHGVAGQVAALGGPPSSADVLGALRQAFRLVRS